ncbi:MAG TPA: hypothetical protein VNM92_05280 [Thermoanaerobaculia bacterium]|nr:hypothetical protein [Thermoanaerobaculia bacterium]
MMPEENRGMPIWGPMVEERLYDPIETGHGSRWLPFNAEAAELAACLEACKQIIELEAVFSKPKMLARAYTLLATPVYSLGQHTVNLHRMLGRLDRSKWAPNDAATFIEAARELRRLMKGPLKELRDKRSAHHDVSEFGLSSVLPTPDADLLLPPLGEALIILSLALNHSATFGYYRIPDSEHPNEVQITIEYPLATLFRIGDDGNLKEILAFHLVADPRHESSATVRLAVETYNRLAASASPEQPPIDLIERDNPEHGPDWLSKKLQTRIL